MAHLGRFLGRFHSRPYFPFHGALVLHFGGQSCHRQAQSPICQRSNEFHWADATRLFTSICTTYRELLLNLDDTGHKRRAPLYFDNTRVLMPILFLI